MPDMVAAHIACECAHLEGQPITPKPRYFELHDDAWPLNGHQRAVKSIDTTAPYDDRYATGRTKLGNGLTILSRGMPAILQGNEWLESNGWESQKIDWSKKVTYRQVFDFYHDLIALRTSDPALFANAPLRVRSVNETGNIIAFERGVVGTGAASYLSVTHSTFHSRLACCSR